MGSREPTVVACFTTPEGAARCARELLDDSLAGALAWEGGGNLEEWPGRRLVVLRQATYAPSERKWSERAWERALGEFVKGDLLGISVHPCQPFDDTDRADSLPPGFPKSELKGCEPAAAGIHLWRDPETGGRAEVRVGTVVDNDALDMAAITESQVMLLSAAKAMGGFEFGTHSLEDPRRPLRREDVS